MIGFVFIFSFLWFPLKADSFVEGLKLYEQAKITEANRQFQNYLRKDPNDDLAWLYLGLTYQAAELWSESEKAWISGLELDGEHRAEIAFLLGNLYLYLEKFARAHDAFSLASLKLPAAFLNKANLFLRQKNYSEALQAYKTYIKLRPFDHQRENILKLIGLLEQNKTIETDRLPLTEASVNDRNPTSTESFQQEIENKKDNDQASGNQSSSVPQDSSSQNNSSSGNQGAGSSAQDSSSQNNSSNGNQGAGSSAQDSSSQSNSSSGDQGAGSSAQDSSSQNNSSSGDQGAGSSAQDSSSQNNSSNGNQGANSSAQDSSSQSNSSSGDQGAGSSAQDSSSQNNSSNGNQGANSSAQDSSSQNNSSTNNRRNNSPAQQGAVQGTESSNQVNNTFDYPNRTAPQQLPEIQQQSDLAEIDE